MRAANGVTIQVAHSDAEGRMVLADTLALAAREKPGSHHRLRDAHRRVRQRADRALQRRVHQSPGMARCARSTPAATAASASGRFRWTRTTTATSNPSIADVLQCTPDSKGDHILAARFLNRFVPAEVPWIHIDLAASNRSGGLAHVPTDFTGFGVRYTLAAAAEPGLCSSPDRAHAEPRRRIPFG